MAVKKL
jgi:hypothetical protein